jgi:hypothetical protein
MGLRGGDNRQVEPLGDARSAQLMTAVIREDRALGGPGVLDEPSFDQPGGGLPQRNPALLSALASEVHSGRRRCGVDVCGAQADGLRDARARVVERRQQRAIAAPAPRAGIGCALHGIHLFAREEPEQRDGRAASQGSPVRAGRSAGIAGPA